MISIVFLSFSINFNYFFVFLLSYSLPLSFDFLHDFMSDFILLFLFLLFSYTWHVSAFVYSMILRVNESNMLVVLRNIAWFGALPGLYFMDIWIKAGLSMLFVIFQSHHTPIRSPCCHIPTLSSICFPVPSFTFLCHYRDLVLTLCSRGRVHVPGYSRYLHADA